MSEPADLKRCPPEIFGEKNPAFLPEFSCLVSIRKRFCNAVMLVFVNPYCPTITICLRFWQDEWLVLSVTCPRTGTTALLVSPLTLYRPAI